MTSETVVAQVIPPSAFQKKKRGKGISSIPAIHATTVRTNETQRPKNTARPPQRLKKRSPAAISCLRRFSNGPGASRTSRPSLRPIA